MASPTMSLIVKQSTSTTMCNLICRRLLVSTKGKGRYNNWAFFVLVVTRCLHCVKPRGRVV